jgi:NOL1/NOP2/sun family putative RNA methylase
MNFPYDFEKKFQSLMSQSEFDEFWSALHEPRVSGLRVNRLKLDLLRWQEITPFQADAVPWSDDGYYLEEDTRPGIHPYYHAGLYYIQEPSAMLPAQLLAARPGDRVLDLCAAPGGKTVRLATDMQNQGLLLSNDINPKRIKALIKNIEISGITNAVVTNESPEKLSRVYENFFNKILLDVPCSGEGMFRKDPDAVKSWSKYKAEELQGLQREIFDSAYRMLAPGGTMVYSTCTFNPEENEKNIAYFLNTYHDLYLKEIPKQSGIEPGRPEWADGNPELIKTARLWPHRVRGEGHFTALMGRFGSDGAEKTTHAGTEPTKNFRNFCDYMLFHAPEGVYHMRNTELHILPQGYQDMPGLKTVKTGLYVGSEERGGFEPSQSLIMAMRWENLKRKESFSLKDPDLMRYLKGETLQREGEKGHIALGVDGFPLGWGKIGENGLKNLYPKGWRKTR